MVRWVICPIVLVVPEGGDPRRPERWPKVATLTDPATGRGYGFSAAAGTDNWALCFVRGGDFGPLDADSQCDHVLESDYDGAGNFLDQTPAQLGWNAARVTRLRNRLSGRGADVTGLTNAAPLWQWLERLGKRVSPSFTPRGTWVA